MKIFFYIFWISCLFLHAEENSYFKIEGNKISERRWFFFTSQNQDSQYISFNHHSSFKDEQIKSELHVKIEDEKLKINAVVTNISKLTLHYNGSLKAKDIPVPLFCIKVNSKSIAPSISEKEVGLTMLNESDNKVLLKPKAKHTWNYQIDINYLRNTINIKKGDNLEIFYLYSVYQNAPYPPLSKHDLLKKVNKLDREPLFISKSNVCSLKVPEIDKK